MGCFISVPFSSALPGLPVVGLPTRWGGTGCQAFTGGAREGAECRTRIDTEPPDLLPTLAGVLVVGPRGETTHCNRWFLQGEETRDKDVPLQLRPCQSHSHPRDLPQSFLSARSSISDPTFQNSISFIMSPKATGVSQESAASASKRNPIDSGVRFIALSAHHHTPAQL